MKEQEKNPQKENTPTYKKPKLTRFGTIKEFTRTMSHGGKSDGGANPFNKRHCISAPPVIEEHRVLLNDQVCQEAYLRLIEDKVKPGDIVLDLGSGTGIHALFAARAGASKVYAVDVDPMISLARQVAADNGYEDVIEFIQEDSLKLQLPEKVDVIISNLGFLGTLESLPDARERFLKPGGLMIPDGVQMTFVPMQRNHYYKNTIDFWEEKKFDLDFSAFKYIASHHPQYDFFEETDFLAEPKDAETIDYHQPLPTSNEWSFSFEILRDGELSGLAGWYSFSHSGEIFISTQPPIRLEKMLWNQLFLPLDQPISVSQGQVYEVKIEMHLNALTSGPVWRWRIFSNDHEILSQNSFQATSLSRHNLELMSRHS